MTIQNARLAPGVSYVETDLEHVVVLNEQTGVVFGIQGTAAVIWSELIKHGSAVLAADALTAKYAISHETATADTDAFVATLVARGLVIEAV